IRVIVVRMIVVGMIVVGMIVVGMIIVGMVVVAVIVRVGGGFVADRHFIAVDGRGGRLGRGCLGRSFRRLAVVLGVLALLLLDQRLPVGDGDLVIVGMDFGEGEETVAVAAIFDKGSLQRGFD